ncbi:MAG: extracellular solute-binding protein [Anaerolineae bacterium]|nr:extracellular solute-binding protein [Anaerolineae bacterium]
MSKSRLFVALFIACLAVTGLAVSARSTVAQESGAVITPQPCAEPGELTMWVWDENWAATIGESIEAWKASYCPDAEVDLQVVPWNEYWNLLQTNAASGDLPDVFNMSQDRFYFYANNDVLLDLQPYWDAAGVDTTV